MKKFNWLLVINMVMYIFLATVTFFKLQGMPEKQNMYYKIEINEIMADIENADDIDKGIETIDLSLYSYVKRIEYLPFADDNFDESVDFFSNQNSLNSTIKPITKDNKIQGYVRFDYSNSIKIIDEIVVVEVIILIMFTFVFLVLIYVKEKILKPFNTLSEMPFELSKGHLKGELEESKDRFFGKFLWGISMLRDTLDYSKNKELKLLRDKKMLLLSLSHDIKIPLSTIKLYSKALKEGMYDTEEKKINAATQIEKHSIEIENYIKEIITTSSEDIMVIEVADGEFYLKDYVEKIMETYEPKCKLLMTNLNIGKYSNKLIKGDIEKSLEVMENVMENALKYGDKQDISLGFYEEEYCQIISIYNKGEQVPASEMPHLFDSFYRGSNVGNKSGNGLGLYISKQIMTKMGGDIFAQRTEDGMCFNLVFKLVV